MTTPSEFEGICLIDKQIGSTSFHLVSLLRRRTGIRTIGHAGTLDPFASGVMVLLIGKPFTRQSSLFLNKEKCYETTLRLGASTDTYDLEGKITSISPYIPSLSEVKQALNFFQGTIEQIPPMFSAKKKQGKKLYEWARKGLCIERTPSVVQLQTELISYTYPLLQLKIICSKGTYIRSIGHDLGEKLGCHAHLSALRRISSGDFNLKDCIPQKEISNLDFPLVQHIQKQAVCDYQITKISL